MIFPLETGQRDRQPSFIPRLRYSGWAWFGSSHFATTTTLTTVTGTARQLLQTSVARGFGSTVGVGTTDVITTPEKVATASAVWIIRFKCRATGGGGFGRLLQKGTTTNGEESLFIESTTGRLVWHRTNNSGTTLFSGRVTDATIVDNALHTLVLYSDGTASTPTAYLDGAVQTYSFMSISTTNAANTTDPYLFGNRSDGLRGWDGSIETVIRLDGDLSLDLRSLSVDPWQVIEPEDTSALSITGGVSTQNLAPSLLTNAQTFYAPSVSVGAVSLTPSLVANAQTFFGSIVSSSYGLTPELVSNTQVFYGPLVAAGVVTLAPSLVTNAQILYGPAVSLASGPQGLLPSPVTNTQTFYSATVTASYVFTPSLLTNTQTFYTPSVNANNNLSPSLTTNTSIFYAATTSPGAVTLQPALVTNTQVFYSPTVLQQSNVELLPGLLTNEQSFLSSTVALVPQAQMQFGGWFTSAPAPVRTRKDRDEERQRLGILPAVEVPVTPAEVRELTHEDRQRAHRMAKRLLEHFAPEPSASVAAVALPAPDEQPTISPVELPMEVQATLIAAQKKRAFEQDLVYIVATLIS